MRKIKESAIWRWLSKIYEASPKYYTLVTLSAIAVSIAMIVAAIFSLKALRKSGEIAELEAQKLRDGIDEANTTLIFLPTKGGEILSEPVQFDEDGMLPLGEDLTVKLEVRKAGTEEWFRHSIAAAFDDEIEMRVTFCVTIRETQEKLQSPGFASTDGIIEFQRDEPKIIKESHNGDGTLTVTVQTTSLLHFGPTDWYHDAPSYLYLSRTTLDTSGRIETLETCPLVCIMPELGALGYRQFSTNANVLLSLMICWIVLSIIKACIAGAKAKQATPASEKEPDDKET